MKLIVSATVSLTLVGVLAFALWHRPSTPPPLDSTVPVVSVENGVQVVRLFAKGGYSPSRLEVQAGIPTELIVETRSTYDCSRALIIPSRNVDVLLPATGQERLALGTLAPNERLDGSCSMGMYAFSLQAI